MALYGLRYSQLSEGGLMFVFYEHFEGRACGMEGGGGGSGSFFTFQEQT